MRIWIFVAVIVLSGSAEGREGNWRMVREPMPATIRTDRAAVPAWVDSSVALLPSGAINSRLFPEPTGAELEYILNAASEAQCVEIRETIVHPIGAPNRVTIDKKIANSAIMVFGRVAQRSYGFYAGIPGQLLQISPQLVRGGKQQPYYVFVPVARFRFGGREVCKTDSRYDVVSQIGDEIFVFASRPHDPNGQFLELDSPDDLVGVARDGSLLLNPRSRRAEQSRDLKSADTRRILTRDGLVARLTTSERGVDR